MVPCAVLVVVGYGCKLASLALIAPRVQFKMLKSSTDDDDSWSSQSENEESVSTPSYFQSKKFWQCGDDSSSSTSCTDVITDNRDIETLTTANAQDKNAASEKEEQEEENTDSILHHYEEKLFNLEDYLERIEIALLERGETLIMKVTEEHCKTMIKTLLGISRVLLDQRLKEAKCKLQHMRILSFLSQEFQPFLLVENQNAISREKIVPILMGLDKALESSPMTRADLITAPMVHGAVYKGDFVALLQDIAPDLVDSYRKAKDGFTEQDVMMFMVNEMDRQLVVERREAVEQCIHCQLPPPTTSPLSSSASKLNGLECERSCLQFLCKTYQCKEAASNNRFVVLQNVLVKTAKSSQRRTRNKAPLLFVSSTESCSDDNDDNVVVRTGIIETPMLRTDGACEEFDALVIERCNNKNNESCIVREVWEAKATISPSTLENAICKKLEAIRSLIQGSGGIQATLCLDNGDELSIQPAVEPFLFGLYGTTLQSVDNAVNQARVIACNRALATNADTVVQALQSGRAEISCKPAVDHLASLRMKLAENKWIAVIVEKPP